MDKERPPSIVVIDDSDADQDLIRRAIAQCGQFNVVGYVDSNEAQRALFLIDESSIPAFITFDLRMPKLDGCELIAILRAHPPLAHVPMIVLTGNDDSAVVLRCLSAGATSVVQKPYDSAQFVGMVRALCQFWGIHNLACRPVKGYLG